MINKIITLLERISGIQTNGTYCHRNCKHLRDDIEYSRKVCTNHQRLSGGFMLLDKVNDWHQRCYRCLNRGV